MMKIIIIMMMMMMTMNAEHTEAHVLEYCERSGKQTCSPTQTDDTINNNDDDDYDYDDEGCVKSTSICNISIATTFAV